MRTFLRILNMIVFLPFVIGGFLYLLWYSIDNRIVKRYKVKK